MTRDFFIDRFCDFEGPITQLLTLLPEDKLDWRPVENSLKLRALAAHLIFAVGHHTHSLQTGEWTPQPAREDGGQGQSKQELLEGVKSAFADAREKLAGITETDFHSRQDRFEANGRLIMAGTPEELAVWNVLRHMANHTMQLFWYAKQNGIDADTGTLYFGLPPGQLSTRRGSQAASAG